METSPAKNKDLHGSAPDTSHTALILIDVINQMKFKGGKALLSHALPMADRIHQLKKRVKEKGIPVIYVNDNYGRWKSDFHQVVKQCLHEEAPGAPISQLLEPEDDDYFVIKPKHSGFFSTTLGTLLAYLNVERLILTGVQTDICVLFTANDAYMRDYQLHVPADCVASEDPGESHHALRQMKKVLSADITPSQELDLDR
ncbi:cysteine hydrolase family protein [Salinithrix halophila]|uniref:Cysteine hydrolase family protein n=1 Tax=Salinithrix halophila TaxID=1485204 RepID=A0ABV8JGH6_9BACL